MHVLVLISEDGELRSHIPVSDDSALLICSTAARTTLAARLKNADGRCARCGLFVRSEELSDGRCKGVGCDADETVRKLMTLSPPAQLLETSAVVDKAVEKWLTSHKSTDVTKDAEPDEDIFAGW
tara:strand:- start:1179 stop:1553 length:375 start_codon:yes stop_codon:yes gene_type:complete